MRQEEKIRFGARPKLEFKDNGLLASLRRVERPVQGKNERILSLFAELIEASGLERALSARPFTLLVPHNAALARFQRPAKLEQLKSFIWDHVLEGRLTLGGPGSKERYTFPRDGQVRTMAGHQLRVERGGDGKWLLTGGAPGAVRILETDLLFEPGVLHVLERITPVSTPTRID
jgi:uncharacterized surface protein with fasciclin (FAS1) repeats